MVNAVDFLESVLSRKKINITSMRMLVLDVLLQYQHALSVNDLEQILQPVDRITIYRSLKTFEQKGLVHHIDDGSGSVKFALCSEDCTSGRHYDMHVHFMCTICQATICLPKAIVPKVSLPGAFQPQEYNLLVKGICNTCSV